jgi:two-component system sensor histidine kinase EvgS
MKPAPILVVEDNQMNQHLLVRQLARLGHLEVVVLADGAQALDWLREHACRLVLADCQMPVMDGYEMTRRLRERERRSGWHTPVIALSASVLDEDRVRCFEAGMDDHVAKPAPLAALERALRPWLGQSGAAQGATPA